MNNRKAVQARYREKNRDKLRVYNIEYYKKNPEIFRINSKKERLNYPLRVNASKLINKEIIEGRVQRQPCFMCGGKAEAHHPSYALPLDVTWLCRLHHKRLHVEARGLQGVL